MAKSSSARPTNSADILLQNLRTELAKRGARGMVGLQRKFRIIDDDSDGFLSMGEFSKAIKECGLSYSQEVR